MGSDGVIVDPPRFDDTTCLRRLAEGVLVEECATQLAIKRIHEGVLHRFARRHVMPFDTASRESSVFRAAAAPLTFTVGCIQLTDDKDCDRAPDIGRPGFRTCGRSHCDGEIATASPISENEIAMRFGVSRGPAREAIVRLEGKGMVTRTPTFRRARCRSVARRPSLPLRDPGIALEGMACRLAAESMSDAELDSLESGSANNMRCSRKSRPVSPITSRAAIRTSISALHGPATTSGCSGCFPKTSTM